MNARILSVAFVLCGFALSDELEQSSKSAITPPPPETQDNNQVENKKDLQKVKLDKVTATAEREFEAYQSGNQIGREMLDSNPSGNGDITSILKILPNVQFDNSQLKSTTPGEIDPANISISGGLFYQNNFQLDGFNMNNDLDPIGRSADNPTANGTNTLRGGRSQGLAVDTSLLESITVLDGNVSASYGGFTGGVVEAQVRKPRKDNGGINGWHANISYQYTSDKLTHYFIHENAESTFATSSNENYQPQFSKHLIKSSVEGYIKENLGLIASFNTTQSFIPLYAYDQSLFSRYKGNDYDKKQDQRREIYNYYAKVFYNPKENLTLEASLAYMPQFNTYFNSAMRDSFYAMESGGWQAGLKAVWGHKAGIFTNQLGYSFMEHSRASDSNVYRGWYYSEDKNWAMNGSNVAMEGGYGNMDELQHSLNYKADMAFEPFRFWRMSHNVLAGLDLTYQYIDKERLNPYYLLSPWGYYIGNTSYQSIKNLNGGSCGADSLGLDSCSSGKVLGGAGVGWNGQFFTYLQEEGVNSIKFDNFAYGIFVEDDINFDLGKVGEINTRLGLRFDGDSYMSKQSLAPRFSLNYITPAPKQWQTKITFGANRYYARSIFSYRLYDLVLDSMRYYTRDLDATTNMPSAWVEREDLKEQGSSSFLFRKLKIPYSDELMAGVTQEIGSFSIGVKYIYRAGRDEIMRVQGRSANGNNVPSGYTGGYNVYTNDGRSESDIVSLILQNTKPLQTYGISHQYLLAFDYTHSARTYNPQAADDSYYNNTLIKYDGEIISYRNRPVENFARPFTLRLNTTHTFSILRTKWLVNNFFRFRSGYDKMIVITQRSHPNLYDTTFRGTQYARHSFKPSFSWDMRVGFEVDMWRGQTLYANVDIYNVLNSQNMTTLGLANGNATTAFASASSIPVYELGRQFWVQVGYKF
ncbi:TonB-dependent receptor plug domain-containing protein [Helicobacter sp. 23-1046]